MIDVTITWEQITAHRASEGTSEPFLWPIFFKVDELTLKSVLCDMRRLGEKDGGLGDTLVPVADGWCRRTPRLDRDAWLHAPGGSHGNLPEAAEGHSIAIPTSIGRWHTQLELGQLMSDSLLRPQVAEMLIGCLVVLLEEDVFPSDAAIRENYNQFADIVRERVVREVKKRIWGHAVPPITPEPQNEPAAYVWEHDETQHVFYQGRDLHIHELRWRRDEEPHWKHFDLNETTSAFVTSSSISGTPTGYAWEDDDTQHIFYNGGDGLIHELYSRYKSQTRFRSFGSPLEVEWHHRPVRLFRFDPTDLSGPPEVAGDSRLAAYVWEENESQHIFYRGRDNHIHELYRRKGMTARRGRIRLGDTWRHNDLTSITGAPDAVGSPAAYVWEEEERQCVFYRGRNNHIHELRWRRNDDPQWTHFDLSDITPRRESRAAGNPVACVWPDAETQHVFYRGRDGNLHQLQWRRREGPNWRHINLTDGIVGPAADPAAYIWEDDQSLRVFYLDADGRIHELRFRQRGDPNWQHFDLTRITASDNALGVGSPAAYVWEDDERQCIFYIGANRHIHELRWRRDDIPNWTHFDLTNIARTTEAPDQLSPGQVEEEIAARINRQLNEAPFFADVDLFIGVGFFVFTVNELLQLPQLNPRGTPFVRGARLSKSWDLSSDDWEIRGHILVEGTL